MKTSGHIPAFVLVDDDDDDRMLMRMALREIGSELSVLEFANGRELLDYLQEIGTRQKSLHEQLLVIMDVNMPLLRGTEAVRLMRQHPSWRHVPVLIMSTSNDPKQAQEALLAGANAYMTKPTSYVGMVEQIKETFNIWLKASLSNQEP